MASEFTLQVVTPDKVFYDDSVEMIITRTTNGDRGILKNHIPFVAGLVKGNLRIKKDGKFKDAEIDGGFVTVDREKTVILTDNANWL